MSWLTETLSSPVLRTALLEAVVAGALCGLLGVHVVLRRLSFFTMALTHATFPGVVLAEIAGISVLFGGAAFGLIVVATIAVLGSVRALDRSTTVGVVLAGGFALGVVLLSSQPGFTRELTAFLVGSIITVQPSDVVITAVVGLVVALALAALHKELVLSAFDPRAAEALGYRLLTLDIIVMVAIQLTLITAIPAVGTILAVALIVAPAATARLWTDHVGASMLIAAAIGAASGVVGIALSRSWRLAAGPAIVLVAAAAFALSLLVAPKGVFGGRRRSAAAAPPGPRDGLDGLDGLRRPEVPTESVEPEGIRA